MILTLNRRWLTDESTVGDLLVNGLWAAFTCEDRYRPPPEKKVPGKTAIPCGHYEVLITHSPRFGIDMPLLLNVPGFVGVRIHPGNTPADTEGCVLVGLGRGKDAITQSRDAYARVFGLIQAARAKGELVYIDVRLTEEKDNE